MPESNVNHSRGVGEYGRALWLCFLSSLGVCIAFLPVIPISDKLTGNGADLTQAITQIMMTVLIIYFIVEVIYRTKKRMKFHQAQIIFWPERCQHCARVLHSKLINDGQKVAEDSSVITHVPPALRTSSENAEDTTESIDNLHVSTNRSSSRVRSSDTSSSRYLSYFVDSDCPPRSNEHRLSSQCESTANGECLVNSYPGTRRNRAFVNVFIVFSVFAMIGIPCLIVGNISCAIHNEETTLVSVALQMEQIAILALIPISMNFAWNYYDAVFLATPHNSCFIIMFLCFAIWLSTTKLVNPISGLLQPENNDPDIGPCKHNGNGTFDYILNYGRKALTPFYTECALIGTGIVWECWVSLIPRCETHPNDEVTKDFSPFQRRKVPSLMMRAFSRLKLRTRSALGGRNSRSDSNVGPLRIECGALETALWTTWTLSAIQSLLYSATSIYFVKTYENSKHARDLYIAWCIEILFILPFLIIYMHLSYVSNNSLERDTRNPVQRHVALLNKRKTETHDVLLLLCSCGIFCLCIFRTAAALGLLCGRQFKTSDELALYVFAIVYSLGVMLMIWHMTSFLLRVQRRRVRSPLEIKWTMILLVNMIVTNAMEWLIESIVVAESPLPTKYFEGDTGEVIAILLDPFTTLYGLHAAMIAYEAYKGLYERAFDHTHSLFE